MDLKIPKIEIRKNAILKAKNGVWIPDESP